MYRVSIARSYGNVYVAIYGEGRVLAFNRNGIPIGQVLLPGRDDGQKGRRQMHLPAH